MTRDELLEQITEEVEKAVPSNCALDADLIDTVETVAKKVCDDACEIIDDENDDPDDKEDE